MKSYDLHTHLFTTWEQGRFSLERTPRDVDLIIDSIKQAGLEGIALVNFEDIRFEEFAAEARVHFGKYKLMREIVNALSFTDGDSVFRVIRGQEIPTSEGHVLALGGNGFARIPRGLSLKDTLDEADNAGIPVIADHPLGYMGIGGKRLSDYSERFAAYEAFNGNYKSIIDCEFAGDLNGIAVSDSHNLKDLGNGHVNFSRDIDFSRENNLRDSLKAMLASGEFRVSVRRRNPFSSKLGHVVTAVYDAKIRVKLGWLEV